jgi:hypothetical protein
MGTWGGLLQLELWGTLGNLKGKLKGTVGNLEGDFKGTWGNIYSRRQNERARPIGNKWGKASTQASFKVMTKVLHDILNLFLSLSRGNDPLLGEPVLAALEQ